jgi:hypothetical protein
MAVSVVESREKNRSSLSEDHYPTDAEVYLHTSFKVLPCVRRGSAVPSVSGPILFPNQCKREPLTSMNSSDQRQRLVFVDS